MSKFEHLQNAIIVLSQSQEWTNACLEWSLTDIYFSEQACLCTHTPIIEVCVLTNRFTQATAEVGNCCVKRFMNMPSSKIFDAVKRIRIDAQNALNSESVEFFHRKNFLSDWEKDFYADTLRKRKLTQKQWEVRIRLNQKVLKRLNQELTRRLA